jgi:hypothetical protein
VKLWFARQSCFRKLAPRLAFDLLKRFHVESVVFIVFETEDTEASPDEEEVILTIGQPAEITTGGDNALVFIVLYGVDLGFCHGIPQPKERDERIGTHAVSVSQNDKR